MDDSVADALQDIGLTEYQTRAYVTAVERGRSSLSNLADAADIPTQRIYDVVDDLEELGLVEVHEGSGGKEAIAVAPDVGLTELKRQRVDRLEATVDTAIDELDQLFSEVDTSAGFVSVVSHDSSVRRHVTSAIESAEWWLFLSLPADWYTDLRAEIESAVERGVTVRLLVQPADDGSTEPAPFPDGVLVRRRRAADLVVAADREYGIFRGIGSPAVSRPSLVTKDRSLVEMFQRYSEQFWTASEPLQTDASSPRRYLTPWQALTDNADRLAAGEPLEAYVEGHETETGRTGTWSGAVVDHELRPADQSDFSVVLPEIARLTLDTADGHVTVGGWDATLEDVAAHGVEIRRPSTDE